MPRFSAPAGLIMARRKRLKRGTDGTIAKQQTQAGKVADGKSRGAVAEGTTEMEHAEELGEKDNEFGNQITGPTQSPENSKTA